MTTPASAMPKTGKATPIQAPPMPQNVPANPVPMRKAMPQQGMAPRQAIPSQQGVPPQPGMPPRQGVPPQRGLPPQPGMPYYAYVMPPAQPPQPQPPTPFSRADWLIFALAGIEAIVFIIAFNIGGEDMLYALPGIGLTLMIYTHLGLVALALGKKARYGLTTIFLIIATLLLGAFPAIYGNITLRALNLLIVWLLLIFTTFLMSNIWEAAKMRFASLVSAFTTWFLSIFSHIHRPINALRALPQTRTKGNPKKILPVFLGILLAGVVLAIVLPLLLSADSIFANGVIAVLGYIFTFSVPRLILRILTLIIMWPAFFGVLWGLARTEKPSQAIASATSSCGRIFRLPTATSIILLATLILVYAAFIWVQAVYLFGGQEEAIATGSYSEYARSGFFQLVAVAAINLAVALIAAYSAHNRRNTDGGLSRSPLPVIVVRVGVILLLIQTGVILASAFMRMNLYVGAYGLSLLRILTYLGMAFIAVCLLIACLYTFRARTPVFAATFVAGIVLWAAFNLVNPEAHIASYNVEHYLSGDIEEIDVDYFQYQLSPGVAQIVEKLQGKVPDRDLDEVLESYRQTVTDAPWQAWSLAFTEVDKEKSHTD